MMAQPAQSCTTRFFNPKLGEFPKLLQSHYSNFQPHHLPAIARFEYSVKVYSAAIDVMVTIQKERAKDFTEKKTYDSIEIKMTPSSNDQAYLIVGLAIEKFLQQYINLRKAHSRPYFDKITFNGNIVLSLEKKRTSNM
jgi:hypothetical protein